MYIVGNTVEMVLQVFIKLGNMYESVFTQIGFDFDEHTCSGNIHTMINSVHNPYTLLS